MNFKIDLHHSAETTGGIGATPSFAGNPVRERDAEKQPQEPRSTTAAGALRDPQPRSPANTNLLQTHLGKLRMEEAREMDAMARKYRKEGNHALADKLQEAALEKIKEGQRLIREKQPSFAGGLSANNAKHMLGTQKLSEARRLRSEASALDAKARRAAAEGKSGVASNYRNQANSLRSKASILEREGQRLIDQANRERK